MVAGEYSQQRHAVSRKVPSKSMLICPTAIQKHELGGRIVIVYAHLSMPCLLLLEPTNANKVYLCGIESCVHYVDQLSSSVNLYSCDQAGNESLENLVRDWFSLGASGKIWGIRNHYINSENGVSNSTLDLFW